MKIIWTENAIMRVEAIADYIAKDSPSASKKWKTEIYRQVQPLRSFPRMGRIVPETNRDDVREVFHGVYRIIYQIEAKRIAVLTVRHGMQLLNRKEITDKGL